MRRTFARAVLSVSAAIAAVLTPALAASAQCPPQWRGESVPGIVGFPSSAFEWDRDGAGPEPSKLFVGGFMRFAGLEATNGIASFDGERWSAVGPGLQNDAWTDSLSLVTAFTSFQGKLIVGGSFSRAGDVQASSVASWDGERWAPLGEGLDGRPTSLVVHNGQLYAAGPFIRSGSTFLPGVARWDGTRWNPVGQPFDYASYTLISYGGNLIVGGEFRMIGDQHIRGLARWDGQRWRAFGAGLRAPGETPQNLGYATVLSLAVYNGELVASGNFESIDGVACRSIGRWNGSRWAPLADGLPTSAGKLTVWDGKLVASGAFEIEPGQTYDVLAIWDGAAWENDVNQGPSSEGGTSMITTFRSQLVAGSVITGRNFLTIGRWDGSRWRAIGPGADREFYAVETIGGDLYAGGDFAQVGDVQAQRVARLRNGAWEPLGDGFDSFVFDFAEFEGGVIAAGDFRTSGQTLLSGVARWDGSAWTPLGEGFDSVVFCVEVHQGELYAGGRFAFSGSDFVGGVAKWNGTRWEPIGSGISGVDPDTGAPAAVVTLTSFGDDLIAGGDFTGIDDVFTRGIAAWNGRFWRPLGSSGSGVTGVFPFVLTSTVFNGELYIGGSFDDIDGVPSTGGIARLVSGEWRPVGDGILGVTNNFVYSLGTHQGELYVGGAYDGVAGFPQIRNIGRWNGVNWSTVSENGPFLRYLFNEFPSVQGIATLNGSLVIAGQFTDLDGRAAGNIAFYNGPACTVPCAADFNGDGRLNADDLGDYITGYFNDPVDLRADFNGDGLINPDDLSDYVTVYFDGC